MRIATIEDSRVIQQLIRCQLISFFLVFFFSYYAFANENGLRINASELNSEKFFMRLDGDWDFYWEAFYNYDDIIKEDTDRKAFSVSVPSYWTTIETEGGALPGEGFGTYHRRIYLPSSHPEKLSLIVPVFDASHRLFINNKLVSESGIAGTAKENSSPGYNPELVTINLPNDSLDILIHVSNFHHRRGGFWKSLYIGKPEISVKKKESSAFISIISIGILVSFSIFFLSFYILYKKNLIALYFSIALFGVFVRLLNTDIYPLLEMNFPWLWTIRLEYLGSFIALFGGIWYFNKLFPGDLVRKISTGISVLIVLQVFLILLSPVSVFSYTMFFFQPVSVLMLVYYLLVSFRFAIRGSRHSLAIFSGVLIFITALLNDIFVANSENFLFGNYITHFAIQLFVMIEGIAILSQWIDAYKRTEDLYSEIEYINENLEKLVDDRTRELNKKNLEVLNKGKQIQLKNEELEKVVMFNQKLFSIIAHDLKSPVTSMYQLSDFYYEKQKDPNMKEAFRSMRNLTNSSLSLIENLLFWGRSQGNNIQVNKLMVNLNSVIAEINAFFDLSTKQKDISLIVDADPDIRCFTDGQIILIILRNLVSNAIKFTPRGGEIYVSLAKNEGLITIAVRDSGKGLEEEVLGKMQEGDFPKSTYGTSNEKGSGLGLPLCFELAHLLGAKLRLQNHPEGGLEVKITFSC